MHSTIPRIPSTLRPRGGSPPLRNNSLFGKDASPESSRSATATSPSTFWRSPMSVGFPSAPSSSGSRFKLTRESTTSECHISNNPTASGSEGASLLTGKRTSLRMKRLAKGLKKIATPMKLARLADKGFDGKKDGNSSDELCPVLLVDFPMFFSISHGSHYSSSMCFLIHDESAKPGPPSQSSSSLSSCS